MVRVRPINQKEIDLGKLKSHYLAYKGQFLTILCRSDLYLTLDYRLRADSTSPEDLEQHTAT